MAIVTITSISQLNGILSKDKDKLSVKCSLTSDITEIVLIAQVIDFHATWYDSVPLPVYVLFVDQNTRCGPCHAIAPAFEALSKEYTSVNFLKCDVDAAFEVARLYSISAMCVLCSVLQFYLIILLLPRPTFIFLKGSTKVDQLKGASKSCVAILVFFVD